jgi:excisionase family DNA binding protein
MTEQILTVSEAARILILSPDGVRRLERVGQLPAHRTTTGVRLFMLSDVLRLAEKRAAKSAANHPR